MPEGTRTGRLRRYWLDSPACGARTGAELQVGVLTLGKAGPN